MVASGRACLAEKLGAPIASGGFPHEKISAHTPLPPVAGGGEGSTKESVANLGTTGLSLCGEGRVGSHFLPAMVPGATESGFKAN